MEYYIICRTGEESIKFVDEYWPDEDGNMMFTTSGSFNWARTFKDYDIACEVASEINHKYDEDGYYVYDVVVVTHDYIVENHLYY